MALVLVLVFVLLLVGSIATFLHRAVLDATIVANRDATSRAEALARGGVRLATALLLEDRLEEQASGLRAETRRDPWARARRLALPLADDATLSLRVEDAGARLDLNALFEEGKLRDPASEVLLVELFARVLADAGLATARGGPEPGELARSLIDYVDADTEDLRGGYEDDWYQRQDPPYRAANRPLLSVDELGLVRGFDAALVEALTRAATGSTRTPPRPGCSGCSSTATRASSAWPTSRWSRRSCAAARWACSAPTPPTIRAARRSPRPSPARCSHPPPGPPTCSS
jgi:general secretion pathway protein K